MNLVKKARGLIHDPAFMRAFHNWAAVGWLVIGIPVAIVFRDSTPFLVAISVYAIVVSHWSGGQAAQADEHQREHDA